MLDNMLEPAMDKFCVCVRVNIQMHVSVLGVSMWRPRVNHRS